MTNNLSTLNDVLVLAFTNIVGEQNIFVDDISMQKYGRDETEDLFYPPQVVVTPGTSQEISE